jgi:hypothetical protein
MINTYDRTKTTIMNNRYRVPRDIELYVNRNIDRVDELSDELKDYIEKINTFNNNNLEKYYSCREYNTGHTSLINQIVSKQKDETVFTIKCILCGYIRLNL